MSPTTVTVKLPGLMNGATITTTGDFAIIHVNGIDTLDDAKKIFQAAAKSGAKRGTLFTGKVVKPQLLAKYERLARAGKTQLGGKVTKVAPQHFRLDFDKFPFV